MNYIDTIATHIQQVAEGPNADERDLALYRLYAVLALAKGQATTNEDVHDAWAAWKAASDVGHRSLVPFAHLTPEVRALDTPYTLAIRQVAAQRSGRGNS